MDIVAELDFWGKEPLDVDLLVAHVATSYREGSAMHCTDIQLCS